MRQTIIILIILLGLAGGAYYVVKNDLSTQEDEMKNSQMLTQEGQYPIVKSEVRYFEDANGFLARPEANGNYPGVVMIHENRGLRPEIKQSAETLAKEGYLVLAVNLLDGVAEDQEGARALTAKFNQATGVANMQAAVAYLRGQGATKIASLGWCFGGKQSLELSISGEPLDATVVYYGGGMATSIDQLAPIYWPVLGIFGDQDQVLPVEM